jgi:hypothetical protein
VLQLVVLKLRMIDVTGYPKQFFSVIPGKFFDNITVGQKTEIRKVKEVPPASRRVQRAGKSWHTETVVPRRFGSAFYSRHQARKERNTHSVWIQEICMVTTLAS